MTVYATVDDVILLGRELTAAEQDKTERLLEIASSKLRIIAAKRGIDLDAKAAESEDYSNALCEVTVRAVVRALDSSADRTPAVTQASQAAMGYSVSATYLNAGQSLYFLKNELRELGILRQRYGGLVF